MANIVTRVTLDEIKDNFLEIYGGNDWEYALTTAYTENDKPLSNYSDNDEFYTDDIAYIAVEDARELVTSEQAWLYIIDNDLEKDFFESMFFDHLKDEMMRKTTNTQVTYYDKHKAYIEYASADMEHYLEWLWRAKE